MKEKIEVVPVELVLSFVGHLCSGCQAKWREMMATHRADVEQPTIVVIPAAEKHKKLWAQQMEQIIKDISAKNKIDPSVLRMKCNAQRFVQARRQVSIAARKLNISYPVIGKFLHRHHTSIIHLVEGRQPRASFKNSHAR